MESLTISGSSIDGSSGYDFDDENQIVMQYSSRFDAVYICENGHESHVPLSTDAEVPVSWECVVCSNVARLKNSEIDAPEIAARPKSTPWDKLMERRSKDELESMLAERISQLRSGEIARVYTV